MKAAAQFLLAVRDVGADGLHHTVANAHETQWHVHDPITDVAAMKSLFPVVVQAAATLGLDAALQTQLNTADHQDSATTRAPTRRHTARS